MKITRMDHISINVNDLSKTKEFFVDLGLEVKAEWEMDGELLDKVVGMKDVKTSCVGMGVPNGQVWIELVKYRTPSDENGIQQTHPNTLGIRHICFAVDDLDTMVAHLKEKGTEIFSEVQQYEDTYRLCYVRGPEGIILELAEEIR